ncbi:Prophage integrase IntS [Frigidibacter albus]
MKMKAATVEAMQATDRRQEIPDDLCTGLYLVVQPTGKKSWQVRYRHGGVHRRMTLAAYPVLSLAEARQRAREVMAAASEGRDPAEEVKAAKAPKPEDDRDKVAALVAQYDRRHLSKLKSGEMVRRELDRFVVAQWGERDIHDITRRDVIDLLDGIVDSGRVTTANRVRAYVGGFLNWCVSRDILAANPATGVRPPAPEKARERVLSHDEIRWFWQACEANAFPFGMLHKMLLLTGQRLREVAQMTWREVDGGTWTLPAARSKNGDAHIVPLSPEARAILDGLPRIGRHVFTTNGVNPVSGFSRAKARLDRLMGEAANKGAPEGAEPLVMPPFTIHDLRRTMATGAADLRFPPHVVEAVLNHKSGTRRGVAGIYNRAAYSEEKRQALEAWARFVLSLVEGKAENVVRIGGRGGV